MTDVWYCIADCSYWVFKVMRAMGMTPNLIFIGTGAALFMYWMYLQHKYNQEAVAKGGYK